MLRTSRLGRALTTGIDRDVRQHLDRAHLHECRGSNNLLTGSLERSSLACLNQCVRHNATKAEVADLIERFLADRLAYPQEWNDFVECRQSDPDVEMYRKKCHNLDPLVNHPDPIDQNAIIKLRLIAKELRDE